jgi:hypothetical protein
LQLPLAAPDLAAEREEVIIETAAAKSVPSSWWSSPHRWWEVVEGVVVAVSLGPRAGFFFIGSWLMSLP